MAPADRFRPPAIAAARPAVPQQASGAADDSPLLNSRMLFAGGRQVRIDHHGQTYTLSITRENKLILTK